MTVERSDEEDRIDALMAQMDGDLEKMESTEVRPKEESSKRFLRKTMALSPRQLKKTRMALQTLSETALDLETDSFSREKINGLNGVNGVNGVNGGSHKKDKDATPDE